MHNPSLWYHNLGLWCIIYDYGIIVQTAFHMHQWATVIGLLKNWPVKFRPVIFGLLPYANEEWRHIFSNFEKYNRPVILGICLPGVTAFRG